MTEPVTAPSPWLTRPHELDTRRRRIETMTRIMEGLYPHLYSLDKSLLTDQADDLLNKIREDLLWNLAWAGALNDMWVFNECGEHVSTIGCLSTGEERDPFMLASNGYGCELVHFVEMCPGYVGLPGTKQYGEDAIIELAKNWLARD